jgi:hypothetical protein
MPRPCPSITSRMFGVDLDGSRRIWTDPLDDHRDDQGASDRNRKASERPRSLPAMPGAPATTCWREARVSMRLSATAKEATRAGAAATTPGPGCRRRLLRPRRSQRRQDRQRRRQRPAHWRTRRRLPLRDGSADGTVTAAGDDTLVGRGGNDALFADNVNFAGSATVGTMGGRDLIEAGDGVDTLRAGPANDLRDGGPGTPDDCDGEAGTDTTRGCEILAGVP